MLTLTNKTKNNISLELETSLTPASSSIRRRPVNTFLSLKAGERLELCHAMSMEPAQVRAVLDRSPHFRRLHNSGKIALTDAGQQ